MQAEPHCNLRLGKVAAAGDVTDRRPLRPGSLDARHEMTPSRTPRRGTHGALGTRRIPGESRAGVFLEGTQVVGATKSIAEAIAESDGTEYVPVTFESCSHIEGPFFHGTATAFGIGDRVVPGHGSNFHDGRTSNHVYFAALLEPAIWGAELAAARRGIGGCERIYVVEPTGPFEDDPNVTNKKFPGNVTQSYRTRHPMRVVDEIETWEGHPPEILQAMLDNIARLREQGLDLIDD